MEHRVVWPPTDAFCISFVHHVLKPFHEESFLGNLNAICEFSELQL